MTKRIALVLSAGAVATVMLALAVGVAGATHSENGNSDGSPKDFAVGVGDTGFSRNNFAAHSGPAGEDPRGHLVSKAAGNTSSLKGPVTCLTVSGNRATIGIEIKKSEPSGAEGLGGLLFVEDNGEPVNGQPVDGLAGAPLLPAPPQECPPPPPAGYQPLVKGNITVHDATP